jgi:hypothetical protein
LLPCRKLFFNEVINNFLANFLAQREVTSLIQAMERLNINLWIPWELSEISVLFFSGIIPCVSSVLVEIKTKRQKMHLKHGIQLLLKMRVKNCGSLLLTA